MKVVTTIVVSINKLSPELLVLVLAATANNKLLLLAAPYCCYVVTVNTNNNKVALTLHISMGEDESYGTDRCIRASYRLS